MLEVYKSSICDLSTLRKDRESSDVGFEAQAESSLPKSQKINNTSMALEKVVMKSAIVSSHWHCIRGVFKQLNIYGCHSIHNVICECYAINYTVNHFMFIFTFSNAVNQMSFRPSFKFNCCNQPRRSPYLFELNYKSQFKTLRNLLNIA